MQMKSREHISSINMRFRHHFSAQFSGFSVRKSAQSDFPDFARKFASHAKFPPPNFQFFFHPIPKFFPPDSNIFPTPSPTDARIFSPTRFEIFSPPVFKMFQVSLGPVYEFVCISFRTYNLNCFRAS